MTPGPNLVMQATFSVRPSAVRAAVTARACPAAAAAAAAAAPAAAMATAVPRARISVARSSGLGMSSARRVARPAVRRAVVMASSLDDFVAKVGGGSEVEFQETMDVIEASYDFTAIAFSVGDVVSEAGQNQGSCKIMAFGKLNGLSEPATLACFGKYYTEETLGDPNGTSHGNIRAFMKGGWGCVSIEAGEALKAKN